MHSGSVAVFRDSSHCALAPVDFAQMASICSVDSSEWDLETLSAATFLDPYLADDAPVPTRVSDTSSASSAMSEPPFRVTWPQCVVGPNLSQMNLAGKMAEP